MRKYRLKKPVLLGLYCLAVLAVVGSVFMVQEGLKDEPKEPDYDYITDTGVENNTPVNAEEPTIVKPYNNEGVKIVKNYYNYKGTEDEQKNSILYYEETYLQNSAVAYGGVDSFDVLAIADGTVISVKEDALLGNIVEIEHGNNVVSVYQSVSDVKVKQDDIVKKGTIIAKSGTSNINADLKNHLLFELIVKGQIVNPEEYYTKKISEL